MGRGFGKPLGAWYVERTLQSHQGLHTHILVISPTDTGSFFAKAMYPEDLHIERKLWKTLLQRGFVHTSIHMYAEFSIYPTDIGVLCEAPIQKVL